MTTFEGKLKSLIEKECLQMDSCTIDISKITPFAWDTMYVITDTTPHDFVIGILGRNFAYETGYRRIVFKKDGIVVYQDRVSTLDSGGFLDINIDGQIWFYFPEKSWPENSYYMAYTSQIFNVRRIDDTSSYYYLLSSI